MTNKLTVEGGDDEHVFRIQKSVFRDFISDLISSRRLIKYSFKNIFIIRKEWIQGYVSLIDQRIASQNIGSLISSEVIVTYNNGKEIKYNSYQDFIQISDVSSDITSDVVISLSYLISFPMKEYPERQDITIVAKTDSFTSENFFKFNDESSFTLYINSSNIAWAEDILNLIKNKISSDFSRVGTVGRFFRSSTYRRFLPIFAQILLFLVIFLPIFTIDRTGGVGKEILDDALNNTNHSYQIDTKIDYLFRRQAAGLAGFSTFGYLSLSAAMVIGVLVFITFMATYRTVELNDKTVNYWRQKRRIRVFVYSGVLLSLGIGTCASLIASGIGSFFLSMSP